MARERMVTRTVQEAQVEAITVSVSTQKVETRTYKISATIPKEKRLAYLQKNLQTDDIKIVAIVFVTINEKLYGMTEQEFISRAVILPPRTATEEE